MWLWGAVVVEIMVVVAVVVVVVVAVVVGVVARVLAVAGCGGGCIDRMGLADGGGGEHGLTLGHEARLRGWDDWREGGGGELANRRTTCDMRLMPGPLGAAPRMFTLSF